MPRGGKRSGKFGVAHGHRTDLNRNDAIAVKTVPGQPYGAAQQQREAQQVIPVAGTSAPGPGAVRTAPAAGQQSGSGPLPGSLGFVEPTGRPGEPVTAGLPVGPGAGPEGLSLLQDTEDVLVQLREAYRLYPTAAVRRLLERVERGLT